MTVAVMGMFATLSCNVNASSFFMQNTQHLSFNLSFSDSLKRDYVGFGLGYRYFPLDGLEVGLDFDLLLGNEPIIYRVSPEIRYVFYPLKTFIPYVGVFYQYNYIVNMENKGGLGARAGFYTPVGDNSYVGYGLSAGELRQCDKMVYGECSTIQVEFNFSLVF
jgi:hypothetical protein